MNIALRPNQASETAPKFATTPVVADVRLRPFEILALAVWFAVLTGLCELAIIGYRIEIQHRLLQIPDDVLWMAPIANVVLFTVPGVLLGLLAWFRPRFGSLRLVAFVYLALMSTSLVSHIASLHELAVLALGVAVGFRGSALLARRPQLLRRLIVCSTGWVRMFIRPTPKKNVETETSSESVERVNDPLFDRRQVLIGSATTVASLAAFTLGRRTYKERTALAALPAADPGRPNVLFIVLDTVRAQNLSLHGYSRHTSPNLDKLARQGVRFRRAIAPSSWTLPSHASMFTGRTLRETKVDLSSSYQRPEPTLAEVLGTLGYESAGFVGNTAFLCPIYGLHRGFVHYESFGQSIGQILESSSLSQRVRKDRRFREAIQFQDNYGRRRAAELNSNLESWLASRESSRPYFAFVNYFDAHGPYVPKREFSGAFSDIPPPRDPDPNLECLYSKAELEAMRTAYDRCILGLDHDVGTMLDNLRGKGHLENTIVIITSDHGEHFGEHGFMNHCHDLYMELLHVPLVILLPLKALGGHVVEQPISLTDLPMTVLDLIGQGADRTFPGQSLAKHWQGGRSVREELDRPVLSETTPAWKWVPDFYPARKGFMQSWIWEDFHYIRSGDGAVELYHITDDPAQERNLAKTPAGRSFLDRLRQQCGDSAIVL